MRYFEGLGLTREPFSNSPDPNFLFNSRQHITCLQELEIAVRLRRGLNVVLGDIGTGKTTLCRRFIRVLDGHKEIVVHLLLDPKFPSPKAFLRALCSFFTGQEPEPDLNTWQLKERIKKALLTRGLKEKKLVVLMIDEGQKLDRQSLEILRELLNYETNACKLLQIVIFAQKEFEPVIMSMPNFKDRINCLHRLSPLGFRESRAMIRFRLAKASPAGTKADLFTLPACLAVYRASRGYPRKIVRICHKAVLALLIRRRERIGFFLVRSILREEGAGWGGKRRLGPVFACLAGLLVLAGGFFLGFTSGLPFFGASKPEPVRVETAAHRAAEAGAEEPGALALPKAEEPLRKATPLPPEEALAPERPLARELQPPPARVSEPEARQATGVRMPRSKLPRLLGAVTSTAKENLSEMIKNVYGVSNGTNLKRVAAANPEFKDIDAIKVGTRIAFPTIEEQPKGLPQVMWVQMDTAATLEQAYNALRRIEFFNLQARILPYWSSQSGLRFALVTERPFLEEGEALEELRSLPLTLQDNARILKVAGRGALFLGQLGEAHRSVAFRTGR